MNFRYIITFFVINLMLYSCVREENNIEKIPFYTVVGKYVGLSKNCMSPNTSFDTLCSSGTPNTFKVIIYDFNTILLTDQNNKYDNLKLNFITTENNGGETIFKFEAKDSTRSYIANYAELSRSFIFENKVATDSKIITDYFLGVK